MTALFFEVLNLSITASLLIFTVVILRLVFRKAPKWIRCALWALVGIRLVFPFSIESVFSLIPNRKPVSADFTVNNSAATPIPVEGAIQNQTAASSAPASASLPEIACIVWLIGAALMLAYCAISFLKLKNSVADAVILRENIFCTEKTASPFILGIIRPKIYIPYGLSDKTVELVTAHENAHLRRRDHLIKPLGFILLAVHWFNPLMWIAYSLLCKDIELACDERVVRDMELDERKAYASALLECGISRRRIAACPLAFGETSIKERVKNALSYKKPVLWIIIIAVIACVVTAVCFLTDPVKKEEAPEPAGTQFTATEGGASHLGISLTVKDINTDGKNPTITAQWSNKLDNDVFYGEQFDIMYYENGKWESCLKSGAENFTRLLSYILNGGSTKEMVYHINNYDISKPGQYRLTAVYELDIYNNLSLSRQLYVYAGFEIGEAAVVGSENAESPPEDESETVQNEFIGVQAASIPYTRVHGEKYDIPQNYTDIPIYENANNSEKLYYSYQRHLPTYAIRNVDELAYYKSITLGGTENAEFTMLNEYGEEFFEENMLIMINDMYPNDNFGFGLIGVYSSGSDVWVLLERIHPNNYEKTDTARGINIAIEVRKELLENAETFDSWIESDILSEENE